MDNIKVGEYARNLNGVIGKIIEKDKYRILYY